MKTEYWHELSVEERRKLKQNKTNDEIAYAARKYKQPKWCGGVPNALMYMYGCWSLLLNDESVNESFCTKCEHYIHNSVENK